MLTMATSQKQAVSEESEEAGHSSSTHSIHVMVRFDTNKTCAVPVNKTTTIGEIKVLAGSEANLLPSSLQLVFAGKLLKDSKTVQDYDLGIQTTLHAFSHPQEISVTPCQRDSLQTSTSSHNRFYIYCKVCDNVRPGKLRVCCHLCESSLFLVQQDPSTWDDICHDSTVRGICKKEDCKGTIPRFYMKCSHPHRTDSGDGDGTTVTLKHIQANTRHVECIICQEVVSPVLIFPCPAGHVICLECFREYALASLNTRQFIEHNRYGYTLPCPSGNCQDFVVEDSHHFYLMGKTDYERFKHFGTEEYVLQNGGILCPGPGCGMGLFPDEDNSQVKCTECQFVCCKHCKREFHFGSCDESLQTDITGAWNLRVDDEQAQRASWERQSLTLIGEISKPCPQCKVKTQHNGGCMHMVCSRCHLDWCWLCVKNWDSGCQEDHWFG